MKYSLPFSFETLPLPTKPPQNPAKLLISLKSQLSSLTNSHQHSRALLLSTQIHSSPFISPDHFTLSSAFKSCAHLRAHILGSQLHSLAVRTGLVSFSHVANSLLSFYSKTHAPDVARKLFDSIAYPDGYSYTTMLSAYAKSGQFERALQLFDEMPETSTPVWNAMITGYIDHGYRGCAFGFFVRMNRLGIGFDRYTFASVLSICDSVEFVGFGRQVHSLVIRSGSVELSVTVVNALVTMYLDCEAVDDALVTMYLDCKCAFEPVAAVPSPNSRPLSNGDPRPANTTSPSKPHPSSSRNPTRSPSSNPPSLPLFPPPSSIGSSPESNPNPKPLSASSTSRPPTYNSNPT